MSPHHHPLPEGAAWVDYSLHDGRHVVEKEDGRRPSRNVCDAHPCGKRLNIILSVALRVGQVLGDGDNGGEDSHKAGDEEHYGVPGERDAQRLPHSVVHPEVQTKATHKGDSSCCHEREALKVEGRHGVEGSRQDARSVHVEDEGAKSRLSNGQPARTSSQHHGPCRFARHALGGQGKKGLIDLVDVYVVNLVDAHDEYVAAQQGQEAKQSPWQRLERISKGFGMLDITAEDAHEGGKDGTADGVRSGEAVEGIELVTNPALLGRGQVKAAFQRDGTGRGA